jgi:hypothetical protein
MRGARRFHKDAPYIPQGIVASILQWKPHEAVLVDSKQLPESHAGQRRNNDEARGDPQSDQASQLQESCQELG